MNSIWFQLSVLFILGASIGSFLNVVIYRIPLGLSVAEPKRSFCPHCKYFIPMWHNVPILSWILLRGKCRNCHQSIAFRYCLVEILTAILFAITWWFFSPFSPLGSLILCFAMALWVAITFIDAEHMIIPILLTWMGSAAGLLANIAYPSLSNLISDSSTIQQGIIKSLVGFATGFLGLWLVVELGKLAFGKKRIRYDKPVTWEIHSHCKKDSYTEFIIDGENITWLDLFTRKSDQLIIYCSSLQLNGETLPAQEIIIETDQVTLLQNATTYPINSLTSLAGTTQQLIIPREAMGMGDVHLLGMIGAFFGWQAVLFTVLTSSFYALFAASLGKIGFGKMLPFGPFLVLGALTWCFGGHYGWEWYMNFIKM